MELFNSALLGYILPLILIASGIYFAFKLNFFYILHPIKTIKDILKSPGQGFKSLSVALAGTLGIGNIVGVASAISFGGAGAVFWMWASAFCAMSLKYCEVYLSMLFRRIKNGNFIGGASYYIRDGFKKKLGDKWAYFLSCIFACLCVINSLSTGNLVQINAVSRVTPLPAFSFGIVFSTICFAIIIGGFKRISKFTSLLIPLLTLFYVIICTCIIILNFRQMPNVIELIFREAFSFKSAICGFCGYGVAAAIRYGVSRGVLSNEAGCGTSPSAHASSESTSAHNQACMGILEVFIDTILLCSLSAFVILLAPSNSSQDSMELVLFSFEYFMGDFGHYSIIILCILFAFATVICQFFYGAEAIGYISNSKKAKTLFIFVFLLVLILGSVIPMTLMWKISDLVIGLMTVFNVSCVLALRKNINHK